MEIRWLWRALAGPPYIEKILQFRTDPNGEWQNVPVQTVDFGEPGYFRTT